ncbi:MAG: transglycosylase domain-containing protein, partial [Salinisphaera sp.]|nr:transglycosylase domain-containing protein [Salinisphaera sp.]
MRLTLLLVPLGLATVVFAGYIVYLDVQVRARFAGALWTLPAKVYASPLELYLGQDIGLQGVLTALQRQGYRRSDELDSSGTYRLRGQAVGLHSRAFNFWDGHQPDRRLRITFSGGHIKNIKPLDNGEDLALLRLDPLLIGSIYPTGHGEDRILVQLGDVPPMLPAGLIVVEDRDFLHHFGISLKGIARAAWANLRAGEVVQGGSTITQQLVKNLFLSNQQTFVRKAREALMAILLDAHYSKEAILEAYINEVYLGQAGGRAIHGFGLASYFYFNKPVQELRPHEVALLIGMVKGPSYYDPRDHPERALKRRNLVLQLFEQAGFLSHEEAQFARRQPLGVTKAGSLGTARYPAFIDLVKRQLLGRYRDQDLTSEGLRIFTTLDPTVQAAAERNVVSTIKDLESSRGLKTGTLQTAVIVTSVEGGQVLALVGGRPYRAGLGVAR